jgi:hypothetical protein
MISNEEEYKEALQKLDKLYDMWDGFYNEEICLLTESIEEYLRKNHKQKRGYF